MLESLTKKQKILFFIILLIMIGVIIYYIYSSLYSTDFLYKYEANTLSYNNFIENSNNAIYTSKDIDTNLIVVYICGAVKESKVITLEENSRICDAIDAVGGLTNEADLSNINLAYILEDGEKIYIPEKGEEIQNNSIYSNNTYGSNKININKATQTELETIPGIGPSTALKIINYRNENGKFLKIEDIKNISGIGDAKFNNIKDYITIK